MKLLTSASTSEKPTDYHHVPMATLLLVMFVELAMVAFWKSEMGTFSRQVKLMTAALEIAPDRMEALDLRRPAHNLQRNANR
jgi:hypothetical protein